MKAKRSSKAKAAKRLDIITTLPQTIIETILCLLPIEEAARTSILARDWRYKWTKIPKLKFSEYLMYEKTTQGRHLSRLKKLSDDEIARRKMDSSCKLFYAIHQVMLMRQGPILEFTLLMSCAQDTYFEIDQIIFYLSRNHTIKKLKLENFNYSSSYGLPLSLFSMEHLTDLYLGYCDLHHKPIFRGFGSLTNLTLTRTFMSRETLLHLLSNCPSLKTLCLRMDEEHFDGYGCFNIMELFKCLPVIEHLTTWGYFTYLLIHDKVSHEPANLLIHLKSLCIEEMVFGDGYSYILTFLCALIKCSPNLEKMKLKIGTIGDGYQDESYKMEEYSIILEEYSNLWLEHLNELEIKYFSNSKEEMEFVKFILVRSPNLKKVILRYYMNKTEELKVTKILLGAPRISPVRIIVQNL